MMRTYHFILLESGSLLIKSTWSFSKSCGIMELMCVGQYIDDFMHGPMLC